MVEGAESVAARDFDELPGLPQGCPGPLEAAVVLKADRDAVARIRRRGRGGSAHLIDEMRDKAAIVRVVDEPRPDTCPRIPQDGKPSVVADEQRLRSRSRPRRG